MKKEKKRKLQLQQNVQNESLVFQTMFGAKQKFKQLTTEIEERLQEELLVFSNLGIAKDMMTLRDAMGKAKQALGFKVQPGRGTLTGSYVAYSLGIEPTNPEGTNTNIDVNSLQLPLHITLYYDTEARNKVVEYWKGQGIEVSTYLSQPMLKIGNIRVVIKRAPSDIKIKRLEGRMREQVYETMHQLYAEKPSTTE